MKPEASVRQQWQLPDGSFIGYAWQGDAITADIIALCAELTAVVEALFQKEDNPDE